MISGKKVLLFSNKGSGAVNLIIIFEEGKGKYDLTKKLATSQPSFYLRNKSALSVMQQECNSPSCYLIISSNLTS